MSNERPFWHADAHADRRQRLLARGRVKAALRSWFENEGFVEVDTACLQISPGNETHLHAFETNYRTEAGDSQSLYLHTSPEFAMKKLLAAGEHRIFTFASVFRNGERGPLHSPEFTMLEWYRSGEPYTTLMNDCAAILRVAARATGHRTWTYRGRMTDPMLPPQRVTLDQAFLRHAGIDLLGAALPDAKSDRTAMAVEAARIGVRVAPDDTWSDLFSRILVQKVEPGLAPVAAGPRPAVVLDEYPVHEAALARPAPADDRVAERFELYACGVELANAFGELTDPAEQRHRFERAMSEKARLYGKRYPIDEDFLAALASMPPACGCALGFDRLVMLATGAARVDDVLWTPIPAGRGTMP